MVGYAGLVSLCVQLTLGIDMAFSGTDSVSGTTSVLEISEDCRQKYQAAYPGSLGGDKLVYIQIVSDFDTIMLDTMGFDYEETTTAHCSWQHELWDDSFLTLAFLPAVNMESTIASEIA